MATKGDQEYAEELSRFLLDEIGHCPGHGNQRWIYAVSRILSEVRKRDGFAQIEPREWLRTSAGKVYEVKCCDCGLIHEIEFRVIDGEAEYCVWRKENSHVSQNG